MRAVNTAEMALAYWAAGHGERMVVRLYAFLGRYGHQQESELRKLTIRQLNMRQEEVGNLLRDERESFQNDMINPD